jgi:hypothetical protein
MLAKSVAIEIDATSVEPVAPSGLPLRIGEATAIFHRLPGSETLSSIRAEAN